MRASRHPTTSRASVSLCRPPSRVPYLSMAAFARGAHVGGPPTPVSRAPLARHASRGSGCPRIRSARVARVRLSAHGLKATDTPPPSDGDVLACMLRRIEAEGTPLALGRGAWRANRPLRRGTSDEPTSASTGKDDDLLFSETAGRFRVHPDARYVLEPGIAPDGAALLEVTGAESVGALCERFIGTEDRELLECERAATRVSRVSPTEIIARWETCFVPTKLHWMVRLASVWPGVTVEYYDILDRMDRRSRFTWRGLFDVFKTAALKKKMRVPYAKIKGTTRLRFQRAPNGDAEEPSTPSFSLLSTEETIELVGFINAERVQNKRLARDVLAFLDTRKPPNVSLEAWDERVDTSLKWRLVPGMGQFDVDGLEDAQDRNEVFADAMVVLAFGTVVLLTFAWAFGGWYLHGLERDAAMMAATRDFYD
jgi:hypothetical protein